MSECKYFKECNCFEPLEGEELCILHSKSENKNKETFDEYLRKFIQKCKNIKIFNFQYIFFINPVNFEKFHFRGEVCFFMATFKENASFKNSTFKDNATFLMAIFEKEVDFSNAIYRGDAKFTDSIFRETVNFEKTKFEKEAIFYCANFKKFVYFNEAKFEARTSFVETIFEDEALFKLANLKEETIFFKTHFEKSVRFIEVVFSGKTYFDEAFFKEKVSFQMVTFEGEVRFLETIFESESEFISSKFQAIAYFGNTYFGEETNFCNSTFDGKSYFIDVKFEGDTFFINNIFNDVAEFSSRLKKMLFQKEFFNFTEITLENLENIGILVDLEIQLNKNYTKKEFEKILGQLKISKKQSDLLKSQSKNSEKYEVIRVFFRNIYGSDKLIFRNVDLSKCSFLGTDIRKIEFTNVKWLKNNKSNRLILFDEILSNNSENKKWNEIEKLYRELKHNCEDRKDYVQVGEFNLSEKEIKLKNPDTSLSIRILLAFYKYFSNYNESLKESFFWILFLLIYSAINFYWISEDANWFMSFHHSFRTLFVIPTPLPNSDVSSFACTFERVLSPLLLALLGLTINQKLKR